eukprot:scaffold27155_cov157-Isochrysis_galbana.AAC.3
MPRAIAPCAQRPTGLPHIRRRGEEWCPQTQRRPLRPRPLAAPVPAPRAGRSTGPPPMPYQKRRDAPSCLCTSSVPDTGCEESSARGSRL